MWRKRDRSRGGNGRILLHRHGHGRSNCMNTRPSPESRVTNSRHIANGGETGYCTRTAADAEVAHSHLDRPLGEVSEIFAGAGVRVEIAVLLVEIIARERLESRMFVVGAVALDGHGQHQRQGIEQHRVLEVAGTARGVGGLRTRRGARGARPLAINTTASNQRIVVALWSLRRGARPSGC